MAIRAPDGAKNKTSFLLLNWIDIITINSWKWNTFFQNLGQIWCSFHGRVNAHCLNDRTCRIQLMDLNPFSLFFRRKINFLRYWSIQETKAFGVWGQICSHGAVVDSSCLCAKFKIFVQSSTEIFASVCIWGGSEKSEDEKKILLPICNLVNVSASK